jgi:hypothetical protein
MSWRMVTILAVELPLLSGCAMTPEQAQRLYIMGQALQGAGNAMRSPYASAVVAAPQAVAQAQAQCPIGSDPWVDTWGNQTCRRFSDQSTATTQVPPGQTCPTGAYPTVDNWGNQICRTFGAQNQPRTDYYDTSEGCPVGTYQSVDNWGNSVCKRF